MTLIGGWLKKLAPRPATWLTFGTMALMLALIMLAVAASANERTEAERTEALSLVTFPGAYDRILSFILGLGGLFAVAYGAAVAGSEWSWGTLKAAVARGESRTWYLLSAFAAVAVVVAFGLLLALATGVLAAVAGSLMASVPLDGLTDAETLSRLPGRFGRAWVAVVETAAIGFAIATLTRSQLAGIGAGLGFYFAEMFASIFLPNVVKFLPFSVAQAAMGDNRGYDGQPVVSALPQETAMIFVAVWLLGSLIVTSLFADRAEISG